jgi:glycosyltransferase involved in cell wall biosynthesis
MNIGIIIDNEFNFDIRVRKEVGILKKHGHKFYVLCYAFDDKVYPEVEGINITRIKLKKRIKDILFFLLNRLSIYENIWAREIQKFIITNSIDILHVHDLYMSKSAHTGAKRTNKNIPIILDLHENYPAAVQSYNWTKGTIRRFLSLPSAWQKKEAEYLGYSSKLIVLSEYYKQELLDKYDFLHEENILSFSNVVDLKRFEGFKIDESIVSSDKITLLYFGVVAERRGVFDLINAVHSAIKYGLDIDLLIIGPVDKSDRNDFLKAINNVDLKENINYIPWIDITELVTYIHICDICIAPFKVNPQHESGVANKIFQYMFGARPIIASDCRPQKALIESFNCGLIYSTQEEFVGCIKQLANDSTLRKQLGENGHYQLYKNYDNNNYENLLIDFYKR